MLGFGQSTIFVDTLKDDVHVTTLLYYSVVLTIIISYLSLLTLWSSECVMVLSASVFTSC